MNIDAFIRWWNKWRPDPWKTQVNHWRYEDQINEADQDLWDWTHKQGKYADRPD